MLVTFSVRHDYFAAFLYADKVADFDCAVILLFPITTFNVFISTIKNDGNK